MMNEGIKELERQRTNDRTELTIKIKMTPPQFPQSCRRCTTANNIAVTETAVPGPPMSNSTLKRKPLNMISSKSGAATIPKIAKTYTAVGDESSRSMGGGSPAGKNGETSNTLMASVAPREMRKPVPN